MSIAGERNQKEGAVCSTLLIGDPYAYKALPADFSPDDFESPEQHALFVCYKAEFIDTGLPANLVHLGRKYPHLGGLIVEITRENIDLNGRLRNAALALMIHRPQRQTETAQPQTEPGRIPILTLPEYLSRVESFVRRYVVFASEHESLAVALWVAHAHLIERFDVSPILAVTSAEMRSGKTRLLDCLEFLVPHPFRVVIPSEAVIYTVLSQRPRRTMLLDEADTVFNSRSAERFEGLRAILNSGNCTGSPVLRVKLDGRRREVESFDVFGPKAIAGIGNLPPTVADRSIRIRLKRKAPGEIVQKFRKRKAKADAASSCSWNDVPINPEAPVPDELNDRAADSWEPLIAIAEAAGGDWPDRARRAAVALSVEEESLSTGIRLLSDIRDVFGLENHLTTGLLLERLVEIEGSPWSEYYGKPLSARGLAKLLEPYGVRSLHRRFGGATIRGYFRTEFEDAWQRYCPSVTPDTSDTSGTPGDSVPDVPDVPSATEQEEAEQDMRLALQDGA